MAESFGQEVRTLLVQEASAHNATVFAGVGTVTPVIYNVSSLHAKEITVMLNSSVALQSVSLVLYAVGKTLPVLVPISGPIAATTPTVLRYGLGANQGIGQQYDVVVTNAAAGVGSITAWTAARS